MIFFYINIEPNSSRLLDVNIFCANKKHTNIQRSLNIRFSRLTNLTKNNEIILTIYDIGDYGQNTIRLDFILERYNAGTLSIIADLSMHPEASLQITA
jgi:hypothetical protein